QLPARRGGEGGDPRAGHAVAEAGVVLRQQGHPPHRRTPHPLRDRAGCVEAPGPDRRGPARLIPHLAGPVLGFGPGPMGDHQDTTEVSPLLNAAQAGEAIARIERLQRLTAALASASTAAECARALSTAGRAALEAQAAFVWLVDPRGETLELAASDGYAGPDLEPYRSIPVAGALPVCDALRSGQPIFLDSPGDRQERYPLVGDGA